MRFLTRSRGCTNSVADILGESLNFKQHHAVSWLHCSCCTPVGQHEWEYSLTLQSGLGGITQLTSTIAHLHCRCWHNGPLLNEAHYYTSQTKVLNNVRILSQCAKVFTMCSKCLNKMCKSVLLCMLPRLGMRLAQKQFNSHLDKQNVEPLSHCMVRIRVNVPTRQQQSHDIFQYSFVLWW